MCSRHEPGLKLGRCQIDTLLEPLMLPVFESRLVRCARTGVLGNRTSVEEQSEHAAQLMRLNRHTGCRSRSADAFAQRFGFRRQLLHVMQWRIY